jgi:hypothetical protein
VAIQNSFSVETFIMLARQFQFADLQIEVQERRKALADQGVLLPTDEQLMNKGGRRTPEKQRLLVRMTESALAAGITPGKRHV